MAHPVSGIAQQDLGLVGRMLDVINYNAAHNNPSQQMLLQQQRLSEDKGAARATPSPFGDALNTPEFPGFVL